MTAVDEAGKVAPEAALNFPQTIFRKVAHLRWYGAVSRRNDHVWMVDGVHSTYAVREAPDGAISCDCEGFKSRGVCSHSLAVVMAIELPRLEENARMTATTKARGR